MRNLLAWYYVFETKDKKQLRNIINSLIRERKMSNHKLRFDYLNDFYESECGVIVRIRGLFSGLTKFGNRCFEHPELKLVAKVYGIPGE